MHTIMIGLIAYIPGGHTARLLLNWRSRTAVTCCSSSAKLRVEMGSTKRTKITNTSIRSGINTSKRIVVLTFWRENNQNIWRSLFHGLANYAYPSRNFSWRVRIWTIKWYIQGRNLIRRVNYQLLAQNILTRCQSGTYKMLLFLINKV